MSKTILITGATDGIGLLTAQKLGAQGHKILMHGRSAEKLDAAGRTVGGATERYLADMSVMAEIDAFADAVLAKYDRIDVLINNAGVFKTPHTRTTDGLDIRFVVNTLAPHHLTQRLLPILPKDGRIVSLSSAAQEPVDIYALAGNGTLEDFSAYAQSKLALTIWNAQMAAKHPQGPIFAAVNPGSLLASKMVKEGFGTPGNDLNIGADILVEAALGASFRDANGKYYDNDGAGFSAPHPSAADTAQAEAVMAAIVKTTKTLLL